MPSEKEGEKYVPYSAKRWHDDPTGGKDCRVGFKPLTEEEQKRGKEKLREYMIKTGVIKDE